MRHCSAIEDSTLDDFVDQYQTALRVGYRHLLSVMRTGSVAAVAVPRTAELWERRSELVEYLDVTSRTGILTFTVEPEALQLDTRTGQESAAAAIQVLTGLPDDRASPARHASARPITSRLPAGSPGYGYRRSSDRASWQIDRPEAAIVQQIAHRLLAGASAAAVARELNAKGVPSPHGIIGGWRGSNLLAMITSPRYLGSGARDGSREGSLSAREPLLDEATVAAITAARGSRRKDGGRLSRDFPLLGLVFCGACGQTLTASDDRARATRRYVCIRRPGSSRCGRMSISAQALESYFALEIEQQCGSSVDATLVVDTVIVSPAAGPGNRMDPGRLRMVWREGYGRGGLGSVVR